MLKKNTILVLLIILPGTAVRSQNKIEGQICIDSLWRPVVYLSIIRDLDDMHTISDQMMIIRSDIGPDGRFFIDTDFLPEGDNFYRLHISRKADPPASLIIGGTQENHLFLIINKHNKIQVLDTGRSDLMRDIEIKGYAPNNMLHRIDSVASLLDSAGFNGINTNVELIRNVIYDNLRFIADTCKNPLVALYAIYKTNFETHDVGNMQYFKRFLRKWRKEHSSYFEEFRKKIPSPGHLKTLFYILSCLLFTFIGIISAVVFLKRSKREKNPVYELSVRERKIYVLMVEGKSNKEISESLNIGLSTVKTHINSIYSKLKFKSRKDILNSKLNQSDN